MEKVIEVTNLTKEYKGKKAVDPQSRNNILDGIKKLKQKHF